MRNAAWLALTPADRDALAQLRLDAAKTPVDVVKLMKVIDTPEGEKLHRQHMTDQTVLIPGPWLYFVTFSIEIGQPVGACRHMSMSIDREASLPSPMAVWLIAQELGFYGGLDASQFWLESLEGGGRAVSLVQPIELRAL